MKKNLYMLIMVLVFGLSAYFYYSFVYVEQPKKIRRLKTEIEALNEKLISAQILARELDQVSKLIQRNLALSAKDSLAEDASIPFLNDITGILDDLKIKLVKLNPGTRVNMRDYVKAPYTLRIDCTYEQLGQFVNRLEKSERLITVEGFEIDNAIRKIRADREAGRKPDTHSVDMTISTLTLIKK